MSTPLIPIEVKREARRLFLEEGLRGFEIADRLGISRTTAYNIINRANSGETFEDAPQQVQQPVIDGRYKLPNRDKAHYCVTVTAGDLKFTGEFMYYPNYWDMHKLCHDNGFDAANDFQDDYPFTKGVRDIIGKVHAIGHREIGTYVIEVLTDEGIHPNERCR